MATIHDFESLGLMQQHLPLSPPTLTSYRSSGARWYGVNALPQANEAYQGTDIVKWWGDIERQLDKSITTFDSARNTSYVDTLRAFKKTWTENELDGSINVEAVNVLVAAASVLAASDWQLRAYFSKLRDSLRQLKASGEELPMGGMPPMAAKGNKPSMSKKSLAKDIPDDFGPETEAPQAIANAVEQTAKMNQAK